MHHIAFIHLTLFFLTNVQLIDCSNREAKGEKITITAEIRALKLQNLSILQW